SVDRHFVQAYCGRNMYSPQSLQRCTISSPRDAASQNGLVSQLGVGTGRHSPGTSKSPALAFKLTFGSPLKSLGVDPDVVGVSVDLDPTLPEAASPTSGDTRRLEVALGAIAGGSVVLCR